MPDRKKRVTTHSVSTGITFEETALRPGRSIVIGNARITAVGMPGVRPFYVITRMPNGGGKPPSDRPVGATRRMHAASSGDGLADFIGCRVDLDGETHVFLGTTSNGRGAFATAAGFDHPIVERCAPRFENRIRTLMALDAVAPAPRNRRDRRGRWARRS